MIITFGSNDFIAEKSGDIIRSRRGLVPSDDRVAFKEYCQNEAITITKTIFLTILVIVATKGVL